MDGTTEPVVAVIGHPIAGNPSQFALERAFSAMELEWRVLSFDVAPDKIAVALDGIDVLGIRGVLIGSELSQAATHWYQAQDPEGEGQWIDCLVRGEDNRLHGYHEQRDWIAEFTTAYIDKVGHELETRLWLGDFDPASKVSPVGFPADPMLRPPLPDEVAEADLIVISDMDGQPALLESDDWPPSDSRALVIDLTEGHPELATIRELGYHVLSCPQRRIGTLLNCLQRWTGSKPSREVVHDAIEEYLAV